MIPSFTSDFRKHTVHFPCINIPSARRSVSRCFIPNDIFILRLHFDSDFESVLSFEMFPSCLISSLFEAKALYSHFTRTQPFPS